MANKQNPARSESETLLLSRYQEAHKIKEQKMYNKLQGTVSPTLRWTIFAINIVFWIVGLLTILLGIWAFIQKTQKLKSRTVKTALDVFTDMAIVFACLGLIIFILAFAGCVGMLRQNVRLLKFYRFVLMGILAVTLLFIVGAVVFAAFSAKNMQEFIKSTAISKYREDIDLQNIVDWVQMSFECCGAGEKAYLDWNTNRYFNCSPTNPSSESCSLPFSCCISPNDIDANLINTQCAYMVLEKSPTEIPTIVWPYGCLSKLSSFIKQQAIYSSIGLAVFVMCYCLIIDVIERVIRQIETFRSSWYKMLVRQDSIDNVLVTDLAKKDYMKILAKQKAAATSKAKQNQP